MLHEEVKKYRELSGDTNPNTPISRIGGYLDGYEKALEQEPCEDAISRQAVLDEIFGSRKNFNNDFDQGFFADKIRALPSAKLQEPKTGHWISHREHCENLGVMPSGLGAYEWCSNCDCGIDVREWHMNNYNYCPNCGCRMFEPQESEE